MVTSSAICWRKAPSRRHERDRSRTATPPGSVQRALNDIERLLRAYGHTYEANLAAIVAQTYARDPQAACRQLNSDDWWSDRDAVCAIDLAVDGGFTAEARRDGQQLRRALIAVFTTMLAYGEENASGELVVSQLQKWLESNI